MPTLFKDLEIGATFKATPRGSGGRSPGELTYTKQLYDMGWCHEDEVLYWFGQETEVEVVDESEGGEAGG